MSPPRKKVLIIGASGMVGMATRDAITQYVGADVLTYDLPAEPGKEAEQKARRAKREANYDTLVKHENRDKMLDVQQANWLLRGYEPAAKEGVAIPKSTLQEAFEEPQPDCVVITAGIPRTNPDQTRKDLLNLNVPFFEKLAKDIAGIIFEKVKQDPNYTPPVMINVGNPMDTLTEVFGRMLMGTLTSEYSRLMNPSMEEMKKPVPKSPEYNMKDLEKRPNAGKERALAKNLLRVIKSLEIKIMGMGGILDGARAAYAIANGPVADRTGIKLDDIVSMPVIATHDDNMMVYLDKATVKYRGKTIPLLEYPGVYYEAIAADITKRTKEGGKAIPKDYAEKTKGAIRQSATFATGAAVMQMVDSIVNDKQKTLPIAIYSRSSDPGRARGRPKHERGGPGMGPPGVVMGRMAVLGKEGVHAIGFPPERKELRGKYAKAEDDARSVVQETMMGPGMGPGT